MGSLTLETLELYAKGETFIETGSHYGAAVDIAKKFNFKSIHSIELKEEFFTYCTNKFINDPNIKIWLGDSVDILKKIVVTLNEPATFWLDAHAWRHGGIPAGKYGACPLVHEINSIALSTCKDHVLIIDDVRLFGSHDWDYIQKDDIINSIYHLNPNYKIIYIDGTAEEDKIAPNDILIASTFL